MTEIRMQKNLNCMALWITTVSHLPVAVSQQSMAAQYVLPGACAHWPRQGGLDCIDILKHW